MFAILCATAEEEAALRADLRLSDRDTCLEARKGSFPHSLHETVLKLNGGRAVIRFVFARCGIGKVNAAATAALLKAIYPNLSAFLFAGVAGALNRDYKAGDLFLARSTAIVDYGFRSDSTFYPCLNGELPSPEATELPLNQPVSARVQRDLTALKATLATRLPQLQVHMGQLLTADYFLADTAQATYLRTFFKGDAFDMESGALAFVARQFNVDTYFIRSISDTAEDGSLDHYRGNVEDAAATASTAILSLIEVIHGLQGELVDA